MVMEHYRGEHTDTTKLEEEVQALKDERDNVEKAAKEAEGDPEIQAALEASGKTPEGETDWAKRHADTRRSMQAQKEKFNNAEQELKNKIAQLESGQATFPANAEAVAQWKEDHPDIHDIVLTLAQGEAGKASESATKELQEQITALKESNREHEIQSSVAEVKAVHSDYDELSKDVKFHDWVSSNGGWVEKAIYGSTGSQRAIQAITLYKAENNLLEVETKSKRKRSRKDEAAAAATAVTKSTTGDPTSSNTKKKIWKESEIIAITRSPSFTEEHQAEFMLAHRENRIQQGV